MVAAMLFAALKLAMMTVKSHGTALRMVASCHGD